MTTETRILDCGHTPYEANGVAKARDGRTMCYDCAHAAELAEMATATHFMGYLSSDGRSIINWVGKPLGTLQSSRVTRAGFGGERTYIKMLDATGAAWHGSGPGRGMFVRLHRSK